MPVAGSKSEEASRIHRFASWMAGACIAAAGVWAVMAPSPADAAPVAPSCSTASLLGNVDAVDAIEASSQQGFLVKLNELRRSQGLGNLAWNGALTVHAIAWSEHMSAQNRLYHARDTGPGDGVEPHQDYVTIGSKIVPNWQRLAENVGVSGMYSSCSLTALESNAAKAVDALHRAFVNSPGHYKNMVGDHNQVGIGVHIDSDEMWVTVRFAKGDLPSGAAAQVQSVSTSAAAKYIQAAYGLFQGRTPTAGELSYWTPGVQAGDRRSITTALARSRSRRQALLARPDRSGVPDRGRCRRVLRLP
jgi:uncharacterized protein YkwD